MDVGGQRQIMKAWVRSEESLVSPGIAPPRKKMNLVLKYSFKVHIFFTREEFFVFEVKCIKNLKFISCYLWNKPQELVTGFCLL